MNLRLLGLVGLMIADQGANVVIASRKLENLQQTAKEFSALQGRTLPIACHVGRAAELQNLVQETERTRRRDVEVADARPQRGQIPRVPEPRVQGRPF